MREYHSLVCMQPVHAAKVEEKPQAEMGQCVEEGSPLEFGVSDCVPSNATSKLTAGRSQRNPTTKNWDLLAKGESKKIIFQCTSTLG